MFSRCRLFRCLDSMQLRPFQRLMFFLEKEHRSLEFVKSHFDDTFPPVLERALVERRKPLEFYCQDPADIEPLSLLLLKVFCDTGNLDQMRYLFTMSLEEIERPSTEMFNVYLVGICKGDSFTDQEVENLLQVMSARGVKQDLTTYICKMELMLRLGKDVLPFWKEIKERFYQVVRDNPSRSLQRKLHDLYFIICRSHYDPEFILEVFEVVSVGTPLEARNVFYLFLSFVNNDAASPQQTCRILDVLVKSIEGKGNTEEQKSYKPREITAFNLLLKCLRWGDVESMRRVRSYVKVNNIISPDHLNDESWIAVYTAASSGDITEALDIIEDELSDAMITSLTGSFYVNIPNMRLFVSDVHPVQHLISAISKRSLKAVDEAYFHLERRWEQSKPVTTKTLDLIVASCAELADENRVNETLEMYAQFNQRPTSATYSHLFRLCSGKINLLEKFHGVVAAMNSSGVAVDATIVNTMLAHAVEANDINAIIYTAELCEGISDPLNAVVIRSLLLLLDSIQDYESCSLVSDLVNRTATHLDPLDEHMTSILKKCVKV